jgi:hypothetical protein
MPEKMGGLGVTDLAKFNRALRLGWQWYRWKNRQKPWLQLPVTPSTGEHAPLSQSEMGPMSSPGMTGGYTANGDGTGPVQIGEKKEYYGG